MPVTDSRTLMRIVFRCLLAATIVCLANRPAWSKSPEQDAILKKLKCYPTRYYDIYSDLPAKDVKEAAARMTCLAEEYHRRTAGFSGATPKRMPFYLFSNRKDYATMSGVPKSSGIFTGGSLMADGSFGYQLWHIVQHEAFHQFAAAAITPRLPTWMNEGMAEYFGESIWTGDNFFTGVVPPRRLRRVQALIHDKNLLPFAGMLTISAKRWSADIQTGNYDQVWSMVHFLVHADGGKYQKAFAQCIADIARGMPVDKSFARQFGANTDLFQKRYEEWWNAQQADSSADVYARIYVAVLTSQLARGHVSGQKFTDFDDLMAAIKGKTLTDKTNQFMPEKLIKEAIEKAPNLGAWTLEYVLKKPRLTLVQADQTRIIGTFVGQPNVVLSVDVSETKPKPEKTTATHPTR